MGLNSRISSAFGPWHVGPSGAVSRSVLAIRQTLNNTTFKDQTLTSVELIIFTYPPKPNINCYIMKSLFRWIFNMDRPWSELNGFWFLCREKILKSFHNLRRFIEICTIIYGGYEGRPLIFFIKFTFLVNRWINSIYDWIFFLWKYVKWILLAVKLYTI